MTSHIQDTHGSAHGIWAPHATQLHNLTITSRDRISRLSASLGSLDRLICHAIASPIPQIYLLSVSDHRLNLYPPSFHKYASYQVLTIIQPKVSCQFTWLSHVYSVCRCPAFETDTGCGVFCPTLRRSRQGNASSNVDLAVWVETAKSNFIRPQGSY